MIVNLLCSDCGERVYMNRTVDKLPKIGTRYYNCYSEYCRGDGMKYVVSCQIIGPDELNLYLSNDPMLENPKLEFDLINSVREVR